MKAVPTSSEFSLLLSNLPTWQNSSGAKTQAIEAANQLQIVTAQEPIAKNIVRDIGGVRKLLVPLQEGAVDEVAESTLGALQNVVRGSTQNKDAVREANGIPVLLARLSSEGGSLAEAAEEALETLNELTRDNRRNADAVRAADGIAPIADMLRGALLDSRERKEALSTLLNIACESKASLLPIGRADVVPVALEMVAKVKSTLTKVLALELLSHLANEPANCRIIVDAGGVAVLLDVAVEAAEVCSRCRAACCLGRIAAWKGAMSRAEVCRLALTLFGLYGEPADAVCADATDVDVRQLLRQLQAALQAALTSPSNPIAPPNGQKEAVGPLAAASLRATADEPDVVLNEPEHGLLNALTQLPPEHADVRGSLGGDAFESARDSVRRSLLRALRAEDMGAVLSMRGLARTLDLADANAEATAWLRERPEAVRRHEEAVAAARSRQATSSLLRMSAAKKAASSLARQFNVGKPRPEGDGAVAVAQRMYRDVRSTSNRLVNQYAVDGTTTATRTSLEHGNM